MELSHVVCVVYLLLEKKIFVFFFSFFYYHYFFITLKMSFTKDRSATDNDRLFSIIVYRFMLEETIMGVTWDPERMDSLMKRMKVKFIK